MLSRDPGLLVCPTCRGPLANDGGEGFRCEPCGTLYPIQGGVRILVPGETGPMTQATVRQFGDSWGVHSHLADFYEQQFKDWIYPLSPADFAGKRVLEAGCGKGRHSRVVSAWGPEALYAIDLSEAVFLADHNTQDRPNVVCVRGDLLKLPFPDGAFDVVFCVGVLHHLEDHPGGLRELWRVLRPGGTLCLWVYGREGNGWIVHLVDPVRKGVTSRLPVPLLTWLVKPLTAALYLALKCLYGPITGWGTRGCRLPYAAYLGRISPFPFREIDSIVLDHLCPPIASYLSRGEIEAWFAELSPERLLFRWHNENSWNVIGKKGGGSPE